jgi:hypothetical protein
MPALIRIGRVLEVLKLKEVLLQHLPGMTEEMHEKPQSG